MGSNVRRLFTVIVLAIWILSGPLMTMVCHCAGMGGMCERFCTPSYAPMAAPRRLAGLPMVAFSSAELPVYVPPPTLKVPTPPPRALRGSALVSVTL
jgi:hypothetical protein